LQVMHAANFLHRDIAPENIIIRTDGTPVLLDFGAARRAVAEMSRSLTGIVKAGYSPHEQYTSDGRLQGPWSDIYALGGTLYRAVTGKPPEEATLRFDEDHMASAAQSSKGKYRRDFLQAIDTCLKVRHSERPRSVEQLRPMLLGAKSQPKGTERLKETYKLPSGRTPAAGKASTIRQMARRWPAIAATVAVVAGAYGGFEYRRWSAAESARTGNEASLLATEAEARRKAEAAQRQAALEVEKRQKEKEAADARQRQSEVEEAKRRKEQADAAEAKRKEEQRIAALAEARRKEDEARGKADSAAEAKRKEEQRIAALEEARRKSDEARRKAEEEAAAEDKRKEERRIAALEETRRNEEKRKEDERRLGALPDDDKRAEFVRKIQLVLKQNRCYDGSLTGRSNDAQEGVNKFVENANKRGKAKPGRIELAKATVGDFETWLKDADTVKDVCVPPARPKPVAAQEKPDPPARPRRQYTEPQPRYNAPAYRGGGGGGGGGGVGTIQGIQ
jgi:Protein kinase domain